MKNLNSTTTLMFKRGLWTVPALGLLFLLTGALTTQGQAVQKARQFASAQEAADALIAAAEKFDTNELQEIFGPDSYDIVHTGEPSLDKEVAQEFAAKARTKMAVTVDKRNRSRALVVVGEDDWPFAIPLVRQASGKWAFDTKQGRQELLYRRIGRNELDAIEICRGFVEAQHEYALQKHDGAVVNQYAQRIISTPGKQDGLAWQNPDGTWGGAVGDRAAKALEQSGVVTQGAPFHGYYFKVLKGQGPAAPLGRLDYVAKGVMIGGFALVAYPADYQNTGVKTFMVSQDGVVYEKDLGPKTAELAKAIELFNPDRTWTPVLK